MNSSPIRDRDGYPVDAHLVLRAYAAGCFPMADSRDGRLAWYRPETRAIITWDRLRCPRSLRKVMAHQPFRLAFNQDFGAVVSACADRRETWIGWDIQHLFENLHEQGHAHCVAAYDAAGALVGGCYGLALGRLFCGESMFHRASDASKIAVWYLIQGLQDAGFQALDCQQQSDHMQRFGAYEITAEDYQILLDDCLRDGLGSPVLGQRGS